MKLYYNIVWVDDDMLSTKTDREEVKEILNEYGIRANIQTLVALPDGSIQTMIEDYLTDHKLEMLVIDYQMPTFNGDQLVKKIREHNQIYLPIIFYSSADSERVLFDKVSKLKLDGVYITTRRFLQKKIKDVINSLLKKEQTITQARGLLMDSVSEIDANFHKIFFDFWGKSEDEIKKEIHEILKGIVKSKTRDTDKKFKKFPDINSFENHLKEKFLTSDYDTYTRWRITLKLLELNGHNQNEINILKEFATKSNGISLNDWRNDFAHKSEEKLSLSPAQYKEIRSKIHEQRDNNDKILGVL